MVLQGLLPISRSAVPRLVTCILMLSFQVESQIALVDRLRLLSVQVIVKPFNFQATLSHNHHHNFLVEVLAKLTCSVLCVSGVPFPLRN